MPPARNDRSSDADRRLTPEEDAALRRWHYFHNLGFTLAEPVEELWTGLRGRDKRVEIREPRDVAQPALPAPPGPDQPGGPRPALTGPHRPGRTDRPHRPRSASVG